MAARQARSRTASRAAALPGSGRAYLTFIFVPPFIAHPCFVEDIGHVFEAQLLQLGAAGLAGLLVPIAGGQELPLQGLRVQAEALVRALLQRRLADQPAGDAALGRVVPLAHLEGHAQVGDALARLAATPGEWCPSR